jgi:segregation and condensation protein B
VTKSPRRRARRPVGSIGGGHRPSTTIEARADNDTDAVRPEGQQGLAGAAGVPRGGGSTLSAGPQAAARIVEALLFAAQEPLDEAFLAGHLPAGEEPKAALDELQRLYAGRGVNLVRVGGRWAFRTADDLGYLLERHAIEERRLSRAALETLAIIAYHQPVTRAEIEEIRGVETSKGTIDILLETGWVRPRGRRRAPGKPLTFGTTPAFLDHFSLASIKDLPGLSDLKGAGLLDATLPPDFKVPDPTDVAALMPDELPLEDPADAGQAELELEPEPEPEPSDETDDEARDGGR